MVVSLQRSKCSLILRPAIGMASSQCKNEEMISALTEIVMLHIYVVSGNIINLDQYNMLP